MGETVGEGEREGRGGGRGGEWGGEEERSGNEFSPPFVPPGRSKSFPPRLTAAESLHSPVTPVSDPLSPQGPLHQWCGV